MPSWKNANVTIGAQSPYAADAADAIIGGMRTKYDLGYQEAIDRVFFGGMEKEAEGLKNDIPEIENLLKKHKFIMKLKREIDRRKQLEKAYLMFGADRFMEMAFESGLHPDEVEDLVKEYNVKSATSWYEKMKRWLSATLRIEGQVSTDEIKRRAVFNGIIADPSVDKERHVKEWNSMKVCAGELGASSRAHRGYWKCVAGEINTNDLLVQ